MTAPETSGLVSRFLARLRFPQLFTATAVLLGIDLLLPDFIPFADEILLALLTAMLASFKRPEGRSEEQATRPIKDVTPR